MPFVSLFSEELSRNLGFCAILEEFAIPVCWTLSPPPKNPGGEYLLPLGISGATRILNFKCSRQQPTSLHRAAPLRAPPALGWLQKEARLDSFSPEWNFLLTKV